MVDGFKARQAPGVGRDQLALGALNAGEGGIEHLVGQGGEVGVGLLDHFNAVANHGEVVAGADRFLDRLFEANFVENGPHVEVVGHDQAVVESELIAEEFGNDIVAEAGRPALWRGVEVGEPGVADHHGIELGKQGAEGEHLFGEEFLFGAADHGEKLVRVDVGGAVGGEVLAAAEDALFAEGAVEEAGVGDDFLGVAAIAAAFEGIIGLVVVGNIEHRAEVEIEAEQAQEFAGEAAVLGDEGGIAFFAKGLGVRGFVADEAKAGDAAALLVDGDEGFDGGKVAQVVDEFAELVGGDDVAAEEDEAAGLEGLEAARGVEVQFGAWNAGEEKLAEQVRVHERRTRYARGPAAARREGGGSRRVRRGSSAERGGGRGPVRSGVPGRRL